MDFTLDRYKLLCDAIKDTGLVVLPIFQFLIKDRKSIILRHDIDKKPLYSLRIADIEYKNDLVSTFYTRVKKKHFNKKILKQIESMNHEIGYHYEVLDQAGGDFNKAKLIFEEELKKLRLDFTIHTVCMHGSPLKQWCNLDFWKYNNFSDFNVLGDPYLSINYSSVKYFTDTGRGWNKSNFSIDDIVPLNSMPKIATTLDLISYINKNTILYPKESILITTHPQRWSSNFSDWTEEIFSQTSKNFFKQVIKWIRK